MGKEEHREEVSGGLSRRQFDDTRQHHEMRLQL